MVASAHLGVGFASQLGLGPFTLQEVVLVCVPLSAVSGMGESIQRVRAQRRAWTPALGYLAFLLACVWVAARGLLPGIAAAGVATAASAAFGARMLTARVAGERPRVTRSHAAWAALLGAAAAFAASWPYLVPAVAAAAGLHDAASAVRTLVPLARAARRA
jgi:hypothetical protein